MNLIVEVSAAGDRDRPGSGGAAIVGVGAREEVIERYERSPRDVLRVVTFAAISLAMLAITIWAEDSVLGLEQDLIALFGVFSPSVERVIHGALVLVTSGIGVGLLLVPLVLKRYRLFGYLLVAFVIAYFNALVLIVVVRLGAAVRNPVRADGIAGFTPFTSPQVSCPLPHPWFDVLARPPPRTCP